MEHITTIGLDIAKHVFHAHGADAAGQVLLRKRLTRAKLFGFFATQAPCVVAMEACAGSHYWAREIGKLGHTVRLIPPAYVKPFVKRQKNDAADAEAICEAAQRPSMRFVPVKDKEQQANGVVFRARDLLVHQRTQCINALRGHLSEYGYVFPQSITHAASLIAHVEDPNCTLPDNARTILKILIGTFTALETQIKELDAKINRRSKEDPVARRLMTIPGIGPITATAITALVPAAAGFRAGRDFAAWLGLTPLQKSTGGKQKLGAVSKRGERRFVALSAAQMTQWMAADLSKLDLLVIQIDGIHIENDLVLLAAVGIDGDGVKHPLGVLEGATENAAVVQALLDNLVPLHSDYDSLAVSG